MKDKSDDLYCWTKLIAADNWETLHTQAEGNPYREEVVSEMYKMSKDEMQRYLYLREQMALTDEASRLRTARNEGEEGLLVKQISKKLAKGKSLELIAEELEETPEAIHDIIAKFNLV